MPSKKIAKKQPAKKAITRGNSFLPAGYELPKPVSNYVQLEEGDNRLRILSPAVIGWEAWIDGVAHRAEGAESPFDESRVDVGDYGTPRHTHFWAFLVWNFDLKRVQVWQVTQRGILSGLWNLLQQEEWGDPREYGIIVSKVVSKKRTEYKVVGVPPKPLSDEVKKALASTTLSLDIVFKEAGEEAAEPAVQAANRDDF